MDSKLCGLTGGIVHHFLVQCPYQRTLKKTFYTFTTAQTLFIPLQWNTNVNELFRRIVAFNSVYVRSIQTCLILATHRVSLENSVQRLL
jgi:hypothetical protein